MTDQEKFQKLFDEVGINYTVNGNTIYLDPFDVDGAGEAVIKFWDGEHYPKGKFHEFSIVPENGWNSK